MRDGFFNVTVRPGGDARWWFFISALIFCVIAAPRFSVGGEARIAVAANFTDAAKAIGDAFNVETGHTALFSFGSTGQLYAQILHGAPFDIFLSADQARARTAVDNGLAVSGSRFTYAIGQLVLYSSEDGLVHGAPTLGDRRVRRLAIANPMTAPYGLAAVETMKALAVYEAIRPRLVHGTNILQTYQFVETGNAELGFIAKSQVVKHNRGSRWDVPASLHTPLAHDAVLLTNGAETDAAEVFYAFLRGPVSRSIIEDYGYGVPAED